MSFEEHFSNESYIILKNSLFNYLLRKASIRKQLEDTDPRLVLDIGSGISPVSEKEERTVYADISFEAMRRIKASMRVVADAESLCFKESFDCVACSEVLEHLEHDSNALQEISRVMLPGARLILTVPMSRKYWGRDDELVGHKRRYLREEMLKKLAKHFTLQDETVVSGPLERISTNVVTRLFLSKKPKRITKSQIHLLKTISYLHYMVLRMEAAITPKAAASVMLFACRKR